MCACDHMPLLAKPELVIYIFLFSYMCFLYGCSVCSLRVKFSIDLSFSGIRRLYWIKFKKNNNKHIEKAKRKVRQNSWKEISKFQELS